MNIDQQLQQRIPFLSLVPGLLPHIGSGFAQAEQKIIIVGESHYLAKSLNNKVSREAWYDDTASVIDQVKQAQSLGYIHTRGVIEDMLTGKFNKAYTIFYNLNNAYQEVFATSTHLFEDAAYLNYFQRPAEETGESINNDLRDNQVAYENLLNISDVLQPDVVIFTSSKAYKAFLSEEHKQRKAHFKHDAVPHPASAWWNKPSKNYGVNTKGLNRTGREKFKEILKIS